MVFIAKKFLYNNSILKSFSLVIKKIRNHYLDARSNFFIKRINNKTNNNSRIKVGFLAQLTEVWDKESPVFDRMANDSRFDPLIIVVPNYNRVTNRIEIDFNNNYFLEMYPEYSIKAYEGNRPINLKKLKLDYVFYPRPYEHYLPSQMRSSKVMKYSKCCYIPYGFNGSDVFDAVGTTKAFYRNIYYSFLESDHMVNYLKNQFSDKENRLHHIVNKGYPALESFFSINSKKQTIRTILWTPRWSRDPIIGGSNFIEFKDLYLRFAQDHPYLKLVFRPHPLMFEELERTGVMSRHEIDDYITQLKDRKIEYDKDTPVFDAFKKTDLLITDFSSIIIEFFITGKPIVYCKKNIELNDVFAVLQEGMYTVNNEEELTASLNDIIAGEDDLYEKRQSTIKTYLNRHKNATRNIIDCIVSDHERHII